MPCLPLNNLPLNYGLFYFKAFYNIFANHIYLQSLQSHGTKNKMFRQQQQYTWIWLALKSAINYSCSDSNKLFLRQEVPDAYSELCKTFKIELFAKNSSRFYAVNYFCKKLHLSCLSDMI